MQQQHDVSIIETSGSKNQGIVARVSSSLSGRFGVHTDRAQSKVLLQRSSIMIAKTIDFRPKRAEKIDGNGFTRFIPYIS